MAGLLNITVNIILSASATANPAAFDATTHSTECTDVPPATTFSHRVIDKRPDLFGIDYDVRQMDRTSRLV